MQLQMTTVSFAVTVAVNRKKKNFQEAECLVMIILVACVKDHTSTLCYILDFLKTLLTKLGYDLNISKETTVVRKLDLPKLLQVSL